MKNNNITILVQPAGLHDYWMQRLLDGIRQAAQKKKYQLIIDYYSPGEKSDHKNYYGIPILLAGTTGKWLNDAAEYVEERGGTPVFVNACFPMSSDGGSGVCFTLERAVRDCIDYFHMLGKIHPVLVGLNPSSDADALKETVFTSYVSSFGISPLCLSCDNAGLEQSIDQLIDRILDYGADALLCSNDTSAILMIRGLFNNKINVGADFPVIGMGNSYLGKNMTPSVTTVNFDYFMLGEEAVRLYHFLSEALHLSEVRIQLPTELIIRESTGNIPFTVTEQSTNKSVANMPDYFSGSLVEQLIMLENNLQFCDETDRAIIFGTAKGETYSQLADRLFLAERTVRYRISHILKRLGLHNKADLITLVKAVLGERDTL